MNKAESELGGRKCHTKFSFDYHFKNNIKHFLFDPLLFFYLTNPTISNTLTIQICHVSKPALEFSTDQSHEIQTIVYRIQKLK